MSSMRQKPEQAGRRHVGPGEMKHGLKQRGRRTKPGHPKRGSIQASGRGTRCRQRTQKQKETESNRLKKRDRRENRGITHITRGSPKTTEWTEKEKFEGRLGGSLGYPVAFMIPGSLDPARPWGSPRSRGLVLLCPPLPRPVPPPSP